MGMMLFRKNDPFHWYSLPVSLMTLFRISTLEDWTDIMYFNIFGCDSYNVGGGLTYCDPTVDDCSMLYSAYLSHFGKDDEDFEVTSDIESDVNVMVYGDDDEKGTLVRSAQELVR
jgi:hypothetical protein